MKFYSKRQKLEGHLLRVAEIARTQGKAPDTVWHPRFGYVLIDGEPTDTLEAFVEEIIKARQIE